VPSKISAKESWQQWQATYQAELTAPEGWLALAGLYWLTEGKNTLGSSDDNSIRFPKDMPKQFGTLIKKDGKLEFSRNHPEILIDGKSTDSIKLELNQTRVTWANYQFFIIQREDRYALRLINSENERITQFKGVSFFDYDEELRITGRLNEPKEARKIKINTVYDTIRNDDYAGIVEFSYLGKPIQLKAVSYGKDTPMYVMFADETNQESTYGAGRYLKVDWPTSGNSVVIDFNYSYSPPCAYTEFATCPLPPPGNRIDFKVTVGEKYHAP
jgi:uncharacterized protein (DUF1684 family)